MLRVSEPSLSGLAGLVSKLKRIVMPAVWVSFGSDALVADWLPKGIHILIIAYDQTLLNFSIERFHTPTCVRAT